MLTMLAVWFALLLVLVIFAIGTKHHGGALTLAYFAGLSLIHVPGILVFLGDGVGFENEQETAIGFVLTLAGMAAFVAGAIVAVRSDKLPGMVLTPRGRDAGLGRMGWRFIVAGFLAYFVFVPISFSVPSLTSGIAALGTLLVVGLWIELYVAITTRDRRRTMVALALVPLLPFATVVSGGFISYGTNWALSAVAFQFVIVRRRIAFYAAAPVVVFLGLSLFVTYMGERTGIREVVQQQQASISDRLSRVSAIATEFSLLDLNSSIHRAHLNDRLNQNFLVGAGYFRHEAGLTDLAYGSTIPWWAPIPRAIWTEKPEVGGGGDLVAQYTGISFGSDTSVGVGQVLEFYINFGIPGIVIGFFGLGFVLMRLDRGIMRAFASNDLRKMLLMAMPALNLLQPGGNLLEIVVGTVTALLTAYILLYFGVFRLPAKSSGPSNRGDVGDARALTRR